MTEALKKMLANPFLRQNPFCRNQCFSSFRKSREQNSSFLQNNNSYHNRIKYSQFQVFAQKQVDCYKMPSSKNSIHLGSDKSIKKLSNPFFRKNLIKNKNEFDDYIEFQHLDIFNTQNRISPTDQNMGFLSRAQDSLYKDLSYKTSQNKSQNSKKYQVFNQKCVTNDKYSKINEHNKQNQQFIGKYLYNSQQKGECNQGYLVSPRFASVNYIQGHGVLKAQNLIGKMSEERFSGNFQTKEIQNSRRQNFESSQSIEKQRGERMRPQKDNNCRSQHNEVRDKAFDDIKPIQITVRGDKYYRNRVEIIRT